MHGGEGVNADTPTEVARDDHWVEMTSEAAADELAERKQT